MRSWKNVTAARPTLLEVPTTILFEIWYELGLVGTATQNGLRLFEYVLYTVGQTHNKDAVHLHPIDADRYHKGMGRKGYSRASFYRGVAELIQRGLMFGNLIEVDTDLVVPDKSRSLAKGAIEPWNKPHYKNKPRQLSNYLI